MAARDRAHACRTQEFLVMNRLRPEVLVTPLPAGKDRLDAPLSVVVVGGGLAGCAAAMVLAERGAKVTLVEKEPFLGGRVGAWSDSLAGGEGFEMERGFHAFFRQYYNVRAMMRRLDPGLSMLTPLDDYPILAPGTAQSFANLPTITPFNIIALTRRSRAFSLRDLSRVNARAALSMLTFNGERTYATADHRTAAEYLDSLRFPLKARQLLFDVFAHSFFNPENDMSAAELLMMFHFYFTGNPEGLVFDVMRRPFSSGLWQPFGRYLESRGVSVQTGNTVREIVRLSEGFRVIVDGASLHADRVVLGLSVAALKALARRSTTLDAPSFRSSVDDLAVTRPFAVLRLWLDRPAARGRPPFAGTTGHGLLDNISLYHLFEDESRAWAERTGGSVVELHAYGVDPALDRNTIVANLVNGLHAFYPELRDARTLHERFLFRHDCPAFRPGSHQGRPTVQTSIPGLVVAGDFVKLPMPSALMERSVSSGMLAANHLLALSRVRSEPLRSVPRRGLLAPIWN